MDIPILSYSPDTPFLRRRWLVNANPDLKKLMLMTRGMRVSLACMLRFWWRVTRVDFVLEVVLTHFLVVVIATHTFDARVGKILTRIEVL